MGRGSSLEDILEDTPKTPWRTPLEGALKDTPGGQLGEHQTRNQGCPLRCPPRVSSMVSSRSVLQVTSCGVLQGVLQGILQVCPPRVFSNNALQGVLLGCPPRCLQGCPPGCPPGVFSGVSSKVSSRESTLLILFIYQKLYSLLTVVDH
jgi:hypothetical protein